MGLRPKGDGKGYIKIAERGFHYITKQLFSFLLFGRKEKMNVYNN